MIFAWRQVHRRNCRLFPTSRQSEARPRVNSQSAAYLARRQDAGRSVLRRVSGQSQAALRTACQMAARVACARPWALVRGSPGARLKLKVSFLNGTKTLACRESGTRRMRRRGHRLAQHPRRLCAHDSRQRFLSGQIVKEQIRISVAARRKGGLFASFRSQNTTILGIVDPSIPVVKLRWTNTHLPKKVVEPRVLSESFRKLYQIVTHLIAEWPRNLTPGRR